MTEITIADLAVGDCVVSSDPPNTVIVVLGIKRVHDRGRGRMRVCWALFEQSSVSILTDEWLPDARFEAGSRRFSVEKRKPSKRTIVKIEG